MKFNIFSKKKKKDKGASIKATDFLNPRDGNIKDLKENDKEEKSKSKKENLKEINKATKKELREAEKKKKAEAKEAEKEKKRREKEAKKAKKEEKKKEKEKKDQEEKRRKEEENKAEIIKEEDEVIKKDLTKAEEKKEFEAEKIKEEEEEKRKVKDEEEKFLSQKKELENDDENNNKAGSNHDFKKSNILEINLVKDEINVYFDWYKNIAMLIIFVFLSFVLVLEIYLALSWWQGENDSAVSQEEARFLEISEETKKIRGEAEEALSFQNKLSRANFLLDNHLYWSNFFGYLERNTLANIQYTSFEGDILGNFSIPAKSDTFPSLGQQVYQLQSDPNTIKVNIDSAERLESEEESIEEIEFEIDLTVSRDLFKK